MTRRFQSVIIRGDDVDTMPWRTPGLAWQFLTGRAEKLGEPVDARLDLMTYAFTGELGTVLGERGTYTVEAL